jgi:hypothetical protein
VGDQFAWAEHGISKGLHRAFNKARCNPLEIPCLRRVEFPRAMLSWATA